MSGGNRRLSEAEKPIENDDDSDKLAATGSSGWGIRSARPLNLKEIQKKDRSHSSDDDEGLRVQSDVESAHGDWTNSKSQTEKSQRQPKKKGNKAKEIGKSFLTNVSSRDSEDLGNFEFVNFKDLPKLPKIESNVRGQFVGSAHKFERPITGFRIRVRLLKYPSFSERAKWPGDLLVLEDRTFCWQEKVFSKAEADKYLGKKFLRTDQDKQYHDEINENPASIGTYLHTYIDSDYFVIRQEEKTLIRKCPASHFQSQTKFSSTSAELKPVNSEGESEYGRDTDSDETDSNVPLESRKRKGQAPKKTRGLKTRSGQDEQKLSEKLKKDEEKRKKEEEDHELRRQKLEEMKVKEALKKSKKQLEAEQKQIKLEEHLKKEQEEKDSKFAKYLGSKRPSMAVSARMLTTRSPPSTSKSKRKKPTRKGRRGSSDRLSSSMDDEKRRLSDPEDSGSFEKIVDKKSRPVRKTDVESDDGEYEELKRPKERKKSQTPKMSKLAGTMTTRPVWRVAHRRFLERSGLQSPQSMYIMASIPHMNRRNRELNVCTVKAYPKSGIVILKPLFGYRIIEAKRNHVYRLSWELDSPYSNNSKERQIEVNQVRNTFSRIHQRYSASIPPNRMLGDMGISFEIVPLNELKLVVMGEIVSAEGFVAEPLCVHYLVEMPKGWRNDSISSNLQGITHNSFTTDEGKAHFSQDFFFQLSFSMDSVHDEDTYLRPIILIMVVSLGPSGRVRYEGYAYITIPSTPGSHVIRIQTWKPKPRSTIEMMQSVFLGVSPSLQDIHAVHIPITEQEDCKRANRLGLETEPSGFVTVRLNVIHQVPSSYRDQSSKLELLEKMSSATILKSVQAVIDAFQRARKRALHVKSNSTSKNRFG